MELILRKQMHQKSVKFVIFRTLKLLVLSMSRIFAMAVMKYFRYILMGHEIFQIFLDNS